MINFRGYDEKQLVEIIDFWEQEQRKWNKMTDKPKYIMTRAEAIALINDGIPHVANGDKIIDFYVAAGMLEIKEDDRKDKLYKKLTRYIPQSDIDGIWQEINEINS